MALLFVRVGAGQAGEAASASGSAAAPTDRAAGYSAALFAGLRWRGIGPYRGGRTRAGDGVAGEPNVFYIGAVDGGVWKSSDYGRTWRPIFDGEPTGSIGAIAVAPSDANVIYVGSGESLHRPDLAVGDGMYKSTDAGQTWTHLGLRDSEQIAKIAVDPRDAHRLYVAALGHPYGPNAQRGIFRSTDGGRTFQRVLFVNDYTGGSDVALDPSDPNIVYAALWQAQEGPWENGYFGGNDGGLFRSTDGGDHWSKLTNGLPAGVTQVGVAVAASRPSRVYAAVATGDAVGIYRSDDGGGSWRKITSDPRPAARIGGGDLPVLAVDPNDPDRVYSCTPVLWESSDGGVHWSALKGAPGGDDYQSVWINPRDSKIMLVGSDQGAVVTVNGGRTWSSWYNQPTAQIYHVAADNSFPYRVCGGQQDSGSACVRSRGAWGEITRRDWRPVGAQEYAMIAPDPLDADIVIGGKLTRFNRRTGEVAEISPAPLATPGFRALRTAPVLFDPLRPRILYYAGNRLWESLDLGGHWRAISPDLTRKTWTEPANLGEYAAAPAARVTDRGVIYAVSPSPRRAGVIWAGTDDGLIWLTRDGGGHWRNVTPPQLSAWWKVSSLDAGHFDAETAYAAINTMRLDQMRPRLFRTHDGGRNWTEIDAGLPATAASDVLREDPRRPGLLYAGTEQQVFVSFDDGDQWQSLRLNMPATSVRDLTVKNDDLIAATHGRGFWILDDVTPLRQIAAAARAGASGEPYLYRPETAYHVHWNVNTDTPLPTGTPAGKNPPAGAILDYFLPAAARGPVRLAIYDAAGALAREFSSATPAAPPNPQLDIPAYWLRPPERLSAAAGEHRIVWNLRLAPAALPPIYPSGDNLYLAAVPHDTPPQPRAPLVLPGRYTARLTVDGRTYSQPLLVKMDPRVTTPPAGLEAQYRLSREMYDGINRAGAALTQIAALRRRLAASSAPGSAAQERELAALAGGAAAAHPTGPSAGPPAASFTATRDALYQVMNYLQAADVAPTAALRAAAAKEQSDLSELLARWSQLQAAAKTAGKR